MGEEKQSLNQPITDPLTGAYSRALLKPRLAEELSRAARGGTGCSLFVFDVDYFKSVNDAYGHPRGDEVLVLLVERILGFLRGYDVLFRYGGDEFVLLLPDTAKVDAVRVALRLVDGVRATPFPGEPPLTVSISLGVASFPDDAATAEELLACADRRNYLAKRRGRACAVVDDVESGEAPSSSRLLERDIPLATAQEFLTRLIANPRGALRVSGEPGSGHTRYLAEVAKLGRLRAFEVVTMAADDTGPPPSVTPGAAVLVLADRGTSARATAFVQLLLAGEQPPVRLGVVHVGDGWAGGPSEVGLPQVDLVELLPWSAAALRIWLRMVLQGEPAPTLINWLSNRGGGLPARIERELVRLRARDGLVRSEAGDWTIADTIVVGRTKPRRKLPVSMTELIGRQQETAQVVELLADRRLVTLAGPGGIGKTRLSLAVATAIEDRFDDGVTFVPLADATTTDLAVQALAQALDVTEVPGEALQDTIAANLVDQQTLLVLDNFEQVVEAAPVISLLLAAAPQIKVLVSSRERLSLYGEQVYQVPPLPLPDLDALPAGVEGVAAALAYSPALALFHNRARTASYDFTLTPDNLRPTAELCRRLDGLPLAIELAAARSDTLTPAQMLTQLAGVLDLPGEGPRDLPNRQRTLRGAIDWSMTLLDEPDRDLFTRLGVFAGGCSPDAVARLYEVGSVPDELAKRIAGLVDKSLLRAEPDTGDGPRYAMLATIRAFAADRLDSDPAAEVVRAGHAAYLVDFAARCAVELTGPDQAAWVARIERDYQNVRVAFVRLIDHEDAAHAATVVIGLWRFWRNGNHIGEGREWLGRVLQSPGRLDDAVRARALHAAAVLAAAQDDHGAAYPLAEESLRWSCAARDQSATANAYNALGIATLAAGDYPAAREYFQHCLASWTEQDQPLGMAMANGNLTKVALRVGDLDAANRHAARCLELDRKIGNTRGIQLGLECLGQIMLASGDVVGARGTLAESLALSRSLGDTFGEAMALHQLGEAAALDGDVPEAARLTGEALSLRHDVGDREDLVTSLDAIAALAVGDHPDVAARMMAAAEHLRTRHRLPLVADPRNSRDATLAAIRGGLNPAGVASAWAAGQATPLDVVVGEALDLAQKIASTAGPIGSVGPAGGY